MDWAQKGPSAEEPMNPQQENTRSIRSSSHPPPQRPFEEGLAHRTVESNQVMSSQEIH
jgi:hypothetical protein